MSMRRLKHRAKSRERLAVFRANRRLRRARAFRFTVNRLAREKMRQIARELTEAFYGGGRSGGKSLIMEQWADEARARGLWVEVYRSPAFVSPRVPLTSFISIL